MLGLAEYIALRAELQRLGQQAEQTIEQGLPSASDPIRFAMQVADSYQKQYMELLRRGMREVALNAASHYERNLQLGLDPGEIADRVVSQQWTEQYYGADLATRVRYNAMLLMNRITRSGQINSRWLTTVWSQAPMHGAHLVTDTRVLLSTLAKIEQDVAREFASRTEHRLVRWVLSHRHKLPDVCDDLASNVDPRVVRYLDEHGIKTNPKGLYFVNDLPVPPHPNCQCEYGIVKGKTVVPPGRVRRAVQAVTSLLKRIRGGT